MQILLFDKTSIIQDYVWEEGRENNKDSLGCPCLLQDIQRVKGGKDSRTTYLGRVLYYLLLTDYKVH